MKLRISALLLLFAASLMAQEMPKVVPPSPETSAAFKFTEMPVSLYTGMPNITIPIFEIESGGVKVPISISYHARGVQVAEIASRVGTGWTLNAGGMVSRQVRGLPDTGGAWGGCGITPEEFYSQQSARQAIISFQFAGTTDICDLIPDVFSYSINGISGKAIGSGGTLIQQKYSNIELNSPGNITDGAGNVYSCGVSDYDKVLNNMIILGNDQNNTLGPPPAEVIPNTWHLTRIKTATGKDINFYYIKETSEFWRRSYDKKVAPYNESHISLIETEQQRLDKIIFDEGKVTFEYYPTQREDLKGSYALHKITLYNKAGNFIKQAVFEYEYTNSTDKSNVNAYLQYAENEQSFKRLFLKYVKFVDEYNSSLPPYEFIYDNTILPSRHSNSIDGWGYYNGKNNGRFLDIALDDRTVDPVKVQAGLLKTMVKPEGGRVNFYYEPNTGVNIFPETVWFESTNPSNLQVVTVSPITAPPGSTIYAKEFTISEFKTGHVRYNVDEMAFCQPLDANPKLKYRIYVQKFNPSTNSFNTIQALQPGQQTIINLLPGKYKLVAQYNCSGTPTLNDTFFASIFWREEISENVPTFLCPDRPENFDGQKLIHAAGNRIRKIEYLETDAAAPAITKTYTYTGPGGNPSGRILGITNFSAVITNLGVNGQPSLAFGPWGTGGGGVPFSTYQGNNVGYQYVTEYYGEGNTTIGRTDYEYSMIYDTGNYYEFPYHPPTDNEWLRGKEVRVNHYKKNGSNYELVKAIENKYLLADIYEYAGGPICENHPFLKPTLKTLMPDNIPQNGGYEKNKRYFTIPLSISGVNFDGPYAEVINEDVPPGNGGYVTYYMTGGTMDLSKTTTTDYFDDGSHMINTTEYLYDYDDHYGLAEKRQSTSISTDKVITKYFYAGDTEMVSKPAIPDLRTKNMTDIPLLTQNYRTGTKLSESETVFKNWNTSINLLAPEYIKTGKGQDPTENRIQYTMRDTNNGNILEVRQVNGSYVSYIWGYDDTYPVAMIENITYMAIDQSLVNAVRNADAGEIKVKLKDLHDYIKTSHPQARITTYEYQPLTGVIATMDNNGKLTTYDYDSFKRLIKIVADNNDGIKTNDPILSEFKYNHRQ